MLGLWGGWDDDGTRAKFHRRIKEYGSIWCCVHAHPVRRA